MMSWMWTMNIDREALERAIEMQGLVSDDRREQIDDKLKDEPWEKVAKFAAYSRQCAALKLAPWEAPPCWQNEDGPSDDPKAQALLRRMLRAGLSRFEPDPLVALRSRR